MAHKTTARRRLGAALACVLLLAVALAVGGDGMDYGHMVDTWGGMTVERINDRGRAFVREGRTDSALVLFTIAANKYARGMEPREKAACSAAYNNMGYIYFYNRNDYSSAYTCLLKALEIAEEAGAEGMYPFIYLNIGNIYVNYNDSTAADSLYRKAFYAGLHVGNKAVAITSLCNLVTQAVCNGTAGSVAREVAAFRKKGPRSGEMARYAESMCRTAECLARRDTAGALGALAASLRQVDTRLTPERYTLGTEKMTAHLLAARGDYAGAMAVMARVERQAAGVALDLQGEACESLSVYCTRTGDSQGAMRWHTKGLQLSDSLFRSQQYGLIRDMKSTFEIKKIDARMRDIDSRRRTAQVALAIVAMALAAMGGLTVVICRKNRKLTRRNRDLFRRNEEVMRMSENERRIREQYERQRGEYEGRIATLEARAGKAEDGSTESAPEGKQDGGGTPGGEARTKYRGSALDEGHKQELLGKIGRVLGDEGEICCNDFSIEKLASLAESNSKYVSQVINEAYGKNFCTLLGEARVAIACRRLCDTDHYGNLTIEGIASGLGFKSRSNFVGVFKKVTGLTPSDYKKIGTEDMGQKK